MRTRLLEALGAKNGLVKGAEGVIVGVAYHTLGQDLRGAGTARGAESIDLKHLPLGIWLRMDKYDQSRFAKDEHEPMQSGSFT